MLGIINSPNEELNRQQESGKHSENEPNRPQETWNRPCPIEKFNIVNIFRKDTKYNKLATAKVEFTICDGSCLEIIKTIDKPHDCYFKDDKITFTITVKNKCKKTITDLIFIDDLDSSVKPVMGNEYIVTTTKGIIEEKKDPVKIKDITLTAGEVCTITITGKID